MRSKSRSQLIPMRVDHPEPRRIAQAVDHLMRGRVIGYPTDTLYALAADFAVPSAANQLYSVRSLPRTKPLALICNSLSQLSRYTSFSDSCFRFMKRVLPGPYTFILRATREVPRLGDNKRRMVGVRIPDAPVALAIVEALGRPFMSTSATDAGEISDPRMVVEAFGGQNVPVVLDTGLLPGTPSTVIDWSEDEPVVVRAGAGPLLELE